MMDTIFKKRDILLEMDNTCYPLNIFANDMFAVMSEGAPESFQKWVDTEKTKWITGVTPFNEFTPQQHATQVYNNLVSTGKWKAEFPCAANHCTDNESKLTRRRKKRTRFTRKAVGVRTPRKTCQTS
jgi:predicted secreted acid phosphatase